MKEMNRRRFVGSVAAAVPATVLAHRAVPRIMEPPNPARLDDALLRALGHTVLPAELEPQQFDRALAGFQTWLEEYEPGAELNHGYGTEEIKTTPDDPTPRWQRQLESLEQEARQRQRSFADLDLDTRAEIVRGQIAGDRLNRLPRAYNARHVAVGLLAYFYATPEATDLCYQRAIGKNTCRPLAQSPEEPAPVDRRG